MCGRTRCAAGPSESLVQSISPRGRTGTRTHTSASTNIKHVQVPAPAQAQQQSHTTSFVKAKDLKSIASSASSSAVVAIIDGEKFNCHENVSPGRYLPTIRCVTSPSSSATTLEVRCMRWGICRSWQKEITPPWDLFNARCESVSELNTFNQLLPSRRCVVPVDGFYEFRTVGKTKQPYYLYHEQEGTPLLMAGLYDIWKPTGNAKQEADAEEHHSLHSMVMLTMESHSKLQWLHTRQPCILSEETARAWLDIKSDVSEVLSQVRKQASNPPLRWHPVSRQMNKTTYQGKDSSLDVDKRKGSITSFFGKPAAKTKVKVESGVSIKREVANTSCGKKRGQPSSTPEKEWACNACTLLNAESLSACSICGTARRTPKKMKKESGIKAFFSIK